MEVRIVAQAVVERRHRRQVTRAERDAGMRIDHAPHAVAADRTAQVDEGGIPFEPLVEPAGRHPGVGIDGHGPRARGGAVAIPQRSAEPAPLPQRRAAEHRGAGAEPVDDQSGLDHAAVGVQHEAAGEADLRVAGGPSGEFLQPAGREVLHASREEDDRPCAVERPGDHLVGQPRPRLGRAGNDVDARRRADGRGGCGVGQQRDPPRAIDIGHRGGCRAGELRQLPGLDAAAVDDDVDSRLRRQLPLETESRVLVRHDAAGQSEPCDVVLEHPELSVEGVGLRGDPRGCRRRVNPPVVVHARHADDAPRLLADPQEDVPVLRTVGLGAEAADLLDDAPAP